MDIKEALGLWRKTVAASPEWAKAPEEEKQAVRADFFRAHVAPNVKDEKGLDTALQTFDFATRALKDDVFNDAEFMKLDDKQKKAAISANLYANGAVDKLEGDYSLIGGALARANPFSDKSKTSGVLQAYKAPARMQGWMAPISGAAQLSATGVAKLADAVAPDSEYAAGARKNLENINEEIRQGDELKKRDPGGALGAELGSQLTIGLLTGGPAVAGIKNLVGQGATKLGQFGRWLGTTAVVGGGGTALTSEEKVTPGGDQVQKTIDEKVGSAQTGALLQGGGDVLLSPPVRKLARAGYDELAGMVSKGSRMRDVSDDLITQIRTANPGVSEEEILRQVQQARTNVAEAKGPMFTGAKSGNLAIAQTQAGVPNTNLAEVELRNFQAAGAPAAANMTTAGESLNLPQTAQYVRTKFKPQVAAEYTAAKNLEIKEAKRQAQDAANEIFQVAKQTGVLKEPVGVTRGQLAAQLEEVLADPTMAPRLKSTMGLKAVKEILDVKPQTGGSGIDAFGNRIGDSLDSTPLTVGDIQKYTQSLAEQMDGVNGDDVNRIMGLLEGSLEQSQAQGVAEIRGLYAANRADLDSRLAGLRTAYNEEAAIERSFANQPLKKALATGGSAGAVAKAATSKLPEGQLKEVLSDSKLANTTKAAIAADISDTLNTTKIVDGLEAPDVAALYNKYKDSSEQVREIFKGDKEFLKDFDDLMTRGEAASTLKSTAAVVSGENAGNAAKSIIGGTAGRVTGTGTAAASGVYQATKERINKRTRAILRSTIADQAKFDELLAVTERLQKGDMSYSDAYNQFHGIRAASSAAARTAAGNDAVLENEKQPNRPTTPAPASTAPKGPTYQYKGATKPEPQASNTTTVITPLAAQFEKAQLSPDRMQYAAQVIGQESSFGKNKAGLAKSKADGPAQFFAAAKKDVEKRIGRKLNYKNENEAMVAAAAYGEVNRDYLKKKGIKNPNDEDLYGAHFLGANGYAKLKARIGEKVAAAGLVDRAAFRNNRDYFFDKNGKYRTPAQVIQQIHNNFNKHKEAAKTYLASN